jgi:hypothetical protein
VAIDRLGCGVGILAVVIAARVDVQLLQFVAQRQRWWVAPALRIFPDNQAERIRFSHCAGAENIL